MCPSRKQILDADRLYPCHNTTFSPPVLISRPAPSPRRSHATRLTTSRSPTEFVGRTAFHTQPTRSRSFASEAHASQLPIGVAKAGGGSGVVNDPRADHGPIQPSASARTFHVKRLFGVRVSVVHVGPARSPESDISVLASLNTWNRYFSWSVEISTVAADAVSVAVSPFSI